jgi:two-component system response regulator
MRHHASLLLIDDSPGEQELFRQALLRADRDVLLHAEHNAEAAMRFLRHRSELPGLVLLDWHLGPQRGDRFIESLRSEPRFTAIPVVVFTTSDNDVDLSAAYASDVNGYVVKPDTFEDLVQCVRDICRYWLTRNRTPDCMRTTC